MVFGFVPLPGDFGIEEEVIVLADGVVGGLSVDGFGDQAEWLELAEDCEAAGPDGHGAAS